MFAPQLHKAPKQAAPTPTTTLAPPAPQRANSAAHLTATERSAASGVSWQFSGVRVDAGRRLDDVHLHSDASAVHFLRSNHAIAATMDRDTIFIDPAFRSSQDVVSHELAHIAQLRSGPPASRVSADADAARVAGGAYAGPAHTAGAADPPLFLTLAEQIAAAGTKGDVFDLLRGVPPGSANTPAVTSAITTRFASAPDDCWLALQLETNGPEPLWPAALIAERSRRAAANHWLPEAGNIAADLTGPAGQSGNVRAYFFPGSDPARRALIFAGVHESEPEGTAVAEQLRSRLAFDSAAGRPPAYTTIVVPNLFEDRHLTGPLAERRKIGGLDPNRNFPGDAAPNVRGGSDAAKDAEGRPIFTENRILMALVERFQPQRVASIHAHSLKSVQGDAPGIFVDPRTDPTAAAQDIRLAQDMARAVAAGLPGPTVASADSHVNPLVGNYAQFTASELEAHKGHQTMRAASDPNVLYDPAAPKASQGVSAGGWFPQSSATQAPGAASSPVRRNPTAIYTIEVPEWRSSKTAAALPGVEQLEAKTLQEILLGTAARP